MISFEPNILIKPFSVFVFKLTLIPLLFVGNLKAQDFKVEIDTLHIDTSYAFMQYSSLTTAKKFKQLFDATPNRRLVIFHYGASHIQGEVVTTRAKEYLLNDFGDAGPGYLFPFSAAKTYSGINYKTSHQGNWDYSKSYKLYAEIPQGVRGMTIETRDSSASFKLKFNNKIPSDEYDLIVFFDNNELTPDFKILADSNIFNVNDSLLALYQGKNYLTLNLNQSLDSLSLQVKCPDSNNLLRFYGFSLQKKRDSGILYHPLGVGASPFESVLYLEHLKEQAAVLKPDIVLLDFGTNNILYDNSVPEKMPEYVEKAVSLFREINPEIIIVLTSTQDLYYKGRYIDAAVEFNHLMDSLAKLHDCMYWNFYDLSGGFAQIKHWKNEGFAQGDHIHLTPQGYKIKGWLLYKSFVNTLSYIESNPDSTSLTVAVKNYDELIEANRKRKKSRNKSSSNDKSYVVKQGDTLSEIAEKHGTTVKRIKQLNNLSSDFIKIGQRLELK